MEIMLVFLSTAIGTVAGVVVAVLMMQRKTRVANAGTDIALKTQLQNTEWALASAGRDVEDLRKQIETRDYVTQQSREELEKVQQQLTAALAGMEKESTGRAEAQKRIAELEEHSTALAAQVKELESKAQEAGPVAEESARHIAGLETELAGARQHIAELTSQLAGLSNQTRSVEEDAALRRHEVEELTRQIASLHEQIAHQKQMAEETAGQHASALQNEIAEGRRQVSELQSQLSALHTQVAEQQKALEEASVQLGAERDAARQLALQLVQLSDERTALEAQLDKERRTAAEGMELLMLAQSKLCGAPKLGNGNGNGVAHAVEAVD